MINKWIVVEYMGLTQDRELRRKIHNKVNYLKNFAIKSKNFRSGLELSFQETFILISKTNRRTPMLILCLGTINTTGKLPL